MAATMEREVVDSESREEEVSPDLMDLSRKLLLNVHVHEYIRFLSYTSE